MVRTATRDTGMIGGLARQAATLLAILAGAVAAFWWIVP
jgi:hypothetical protein